MSLARLGDVDIHYAVHGRGHPLVLAHGYCASTRMWARQVGPFSARYQVIAYDARGHGLSTTPAGAGHYALEHLVGDLHALLDHLGIERAHVAGHSMGGATAAAFAARHPERIGAALVCNIDAGHQPADADAERANAEAYRWKLAHARERGLVDLARRQIAEGVAPPFVTEDEREIEDYVDRYARQPLNGYLGVGEALPWRAPWLAEAAASLTGPVAIVAGTEDPMHRGAEALHARLPQSRLVSIAGAPHDSVNARPAAFNRAVLEYLEVLERGGDPAGRFTL